MHQDVVNLKALQGGSLAAVRTRKSDATKHCAKTQTNMHRIGHELDCASFATTKRPHLIKQLDPRLLLSAGYESTLQA